MTRVYPGDTAEPREVALWMRQVAEEEYGIPGILPVMTSCVEITDAWTQSGDVKNVPGYLSAIDHTSVGYFQQQNNWGTYAQRTDANWALRAFLAEAKRIEDDSPADTPEQLGAWCAAVQRPRADLEYLYAQKGYPMAAKLLKGADAPQYPTTKVGFDGSGWALNLENNSYLRAASLPDIDLHTDPAGWLYRRDKTQKSFSWPVALVPPMPDSYYYTDRNPTRYSWAKGGREDVEAIAISLVTKYEGRLWVNTYHHHPEDVWLKHGISREYDSLDVWGPGGRGYALDAALGDEIFALLMGDPNPPDIEWIIYKGVMYGAWNGWKGEPFGSDDFSWHYDHVHVTYKKRL